MDSVEIVSHTKRTVKEQLRQAMLAECDADIQQIFSPHFYTLEPLLMQLIRDIRRLRPHASDL